MEIIKNNLSLAQEVRQQLNDERIKQMRILIMNSVWLHAEIFLADREELRSEIDKLFENLAAEIQQKFDSNASQDFASDTLGMTEESSVEFNNLMKGIFKNES